MRILVLFFLSTLVSFGQVTKEVRYYTTSGVLQQPSNFLSANILAGTNVFIEVNAFGQVTINGVSASSGLGDVTTAQLLVVSNQVQVSSNFLFGLTSANTNQFRSDITLLSNQLNTASNKFNTDVVNLQAITNLNSPILTNKTIAARTVPTWWESYGRTFNVQASFMNNRIITYQPSATTVIGAYGLTIPVNLGGVTVSHPPRTEQWPYMTQLATPATSNACAGTFSSIDIATAGTRFGLNGYFFATEFLSTNRLAQAALTAPAGNRAFIGFTSTANPALTNLVQTTNSTGSYVGLYLDSGNSAGFFISSRDGTAGEFRTNTGLNFVATNLYQFYLHNAPTSKFINWKLENLTDRTEAYGMFSNSVPTNMMKFGYVIRNGTTVVHSIRFSKMYLESPLAP